MFIWGTPGQMAEPVVWRVAGRTEVAGKTHDFWYQYDARDNEVVYEIGDGTGSADNDWTDEQREEFELTCQSEVDIAMGAGNFKTTPAFAERYLAHYGANGDYYVMCKGYGDDDDYTELNMDDLLNDNVKNGGYEDYQLWRREGR